MSTVRPDRAAVATWRHLLTYVRRTTAALDRDLEAERGMTLAEYDVLFQVSEGPVRGVRMSALAEVLLVAPSSCTRVVGHLVDRGWVQRARDPLDARAVVVRLTAAGRTALTRASVVHLRGIEEHFAARLDPTQWRSLDDLLACLDGLA